MPSIEFKGKSFVESHHLSVPHHQFIPDEDASLTDRVRLTDNLIIHGDNLLAIKALLPIYQGMVKCIYIDPPYNTGKGKGSSGWVYSDAVNSAMIKEWLNKVVGVDGLTLHDKWLCMMMPRLKLLRELLCEDGVIFVSIDDNEVHHLRMLMDEVFGAENFVACFVRQKRKGVAIRRVKMSYKLTIEDTSVAQRVCSMWYEIWDLHAPPVNEDGEPVKYKRMKKLRKQIVTVKESDGTEVVIHDPQEIFGESFMKFIGVADNDEK